mmetsp:Transcript_114794/g.349246  ORF Transcript_114794/g.349246 Transcript_114794/m.349246 type:complete len:204 (+) Transcript_114794:1421-2032(+)
MLRQLLELVLELVPLGLGEEPVLRGTVEPLHHLRRNLPHRHLPWEALALQGAEQGGWPLEAGGGTGSCRTGGGHGHPCGCKTSAGAGRHGAGLCVAHACSGPAELLQGIRVLQLLSQGFAAGGTGPHVALTEAPLCEGLPAGRAGVGTPHSYRHGDCLAGPLWGVWGKAGIGEDMPQAAARGHNGVGVGKHGAGGLLDEGRDA